MSEWPWLGSLPKVSQGHNQDVSWLGSYEEILGRIHFQDHSGYWQISVLCGCRTEVLVSCWLPGSGHSREWPYSLVYGLILLAIVGWRTSHTVNFFDLPLEPKSPASAPATSLWFQQKKVLCFEELMWLLRPTCIVQDNLPIVRFIVSMTLKNFLWAFNIAYSQVPGIR